MSVSFPLSVEGLLCVDIGNSSVKLSLWNGGNVVDTARMAVDDIDGILSFASGRTAVAAVCSVGGDGMDIMALLDTLTGGRVMRVDHTVSFPVAGCYASMGIDRKCADVAACRIRPDSFIVVVDAGTAMTVDVVDDRLEFLGGDIAPGVSMQLGALHSHTHRLPLVASDGRLPMIGDDTETAIRCGVIRALAALVDRTEAWAARKAGRNHVPVVISGGDGKLIADILIEEGLDCLLENDLVGLGLNIIYNYNLLQK